MTFLLAFFAFLLFLLLATRLFSCLDGCRLLQLLEGFETVERFVGCLFDLGLWFGFCFSGRLLGLCRGVVAYILVEGVGSIGLRTGCLVGYFLCLNGSLFDRDFFDRDFFDRSLFNRYFFGWCLFLHRFGLFLDRSRFFDHNGGIFHGRLFFNDGLRLGLGKVFETGKRIDGSRVLLHVFDCFHQGIAVVQTLGSGELQTVLAFADSAQPFEFQHTVDLELPFHCLDIVIPCAFTDGVAHTVLLG